MRSDIASSSRVLVINCGSSSLKYRLYDMPEETELARGEAERVGIKTASKSTVMHTALGRTVGLEADMPDHASALAIVMKLVREDFPANGRRSFDCIGHRYVHPGSVFAKTTRVTPRVCELLESTQSLAPIHNPVAFRLVSSIASHDPSADQYLVFDTTFHRTIPDALSTYAIPYELSEKYGIRKVGFHGISHQYVMEEACRFLDVSPSTQRIISCHLGTGGASVCAIEYGKSINSSMGFTPLEGLVMNTRSGDVDIGVVLQAMYANGLHTDDMEKVLNNKSGLLGLYRTSSDLRDLVTKLDTEPAARSSFTMFVDRIRKYVAYNILLLRKADILIFTDTLGVGVPIVREKVCEGFEFLGVRMSKERNIVPVQSISDITGINSETKVLVVPTNEELLIARETYKEYAHDRHN
jgi:acetate kinase